MTNAAPATIAHVLIGLHIGGLEQVVIHLIRGIDNTRFRSVLCYLESEGDWVSQVESSCQAVKAFSKRPGLSCGLPFRLAAFFKAQRVDVVHCHDLGAYIYASLGGRMAGCRGFVYNIHGPHVFSRKRHVLFQRLPLANKIVTVSDHIRHQALETLHVPPDRVVTVVNGVDVQRFADRRARATQTPEGPAGPGHPVAGCVARLAPEKDHETLLMAFVRVVSQLPDARLLIVGEGPSRTSLERRAAELGLGNSVRFLGVRDDVADILAGLDVFVMASRREGLPMAVLEAMAAGLPVIATSVGGIPEVVLHGKTGLLVPPGDSEKLADAMLQLMIDRNEARRMGSEAAMLAEKEYDVARMIRAYEDIYAEVLSAAA